MDSSFDMLACSAANSLEMPPLQPERGIIDEIKSLKDVGGIPKDVKFMFFGTLLEKAGVTIPNLKVELTQLFIDKKIGEEELRDMFEYLNTVAVPPAYASYSEIIPFLKSSAWDFENDESHEVFIKMVASDIAASFFAFSSATIEQISTVSLEVSSNAAIPSYIKSSVVQKLYASIAKKFSSSAASAPSAASPSSKFYNADSAAEPPAKKKKKSPGVRVIEGTVTYSGSINNAFAGVRKQLLNRARSGGGAGAPSSLLFDQLGNKIDEEILEIRNVAQTVNWDYKNPALSTTLNNVFNMLIDRNFVAVLGEGGVPPMPQL